MAKQSLTYQQAGVDIEKGNELVERIKGVAKRTRRPEVLAGLGGFGGLFEIPVDRFKQPVLVSGTDGVGTKLKLAIDSGNHQGIGIDLVAMCVNDLLVCGAEPLYFLDYYATGQLNVDVAESVIASIGQGCEQAGMALIGGETAEMPDMYQRGDYDLAGFAVGIVDKPNIIDGSKVRDGDCLLAMASTGPHANGYSLIRKILEVNDLNLDQKIGDKTLLEHLLAPTQIYAQAIKALLEKIEVHALAHITGGGLTENLPRVLPENHNAMIELQSWQWPEIFNFLQQQGNVEQQEMLRTFNCGVGMVAVIDEQSMNQAQQILDNIGIDSWCLGRIEKTENTKAEVKYL